MEIVKKILFDVLIIILVDSILLIPFNFAIYFSNNEFLFNNRTAIFIIISFPIALEVINRFESAFKRKNH